MFTHEQANRYYATELRGYALWTLFVPAYVAGALDGLL